MSNMILFQQSNGAVAPQMSSKFQALVQAGVGMDLGEGIRSSYAIVGIKGARFNLRYKGETRILDMAHPQDPTQRLPVSFIDVVIVKANPFLNKQFYKGNYVEGSDSAPDCYSLNGKTPSPQVQQPQHANCALCPMNQFGSKIGDDGKKQKACRDTKKLAIVPLADIRNSTMGGAMLFRVPPSALKDLSIMSDALKGRGYSYNSIAVRIGFDTTVSHPKPTFQALRPLSDDEADLVLEMFSSDSVEAVLADGDDAAPPAAPAVPASAQFLQPAPVAAPAQGQPVQTHGWQPGQPLPRIDPSKVPPVAAHEAAPRPQLPPTILNQPVAEGTAPVAGVHVPASLDPVPQQIVLPAEQPVQQPTPVTLNDASTPAQQSAPAGNPFAAPPGVQQAAAAPAPRRKPVTPVAAPVAAPEPAPASQGQLDDEIGNILSGLGEFMGGK